jgi:hypothetical protein
LPLGYVAFAVLAISRFLRQSDQPHRADDVRPLMGLDRKWLAEIWNGGFDPSRHRRLSPLFAHDFHVVSIRGLAKRKLTLSLGKPVMEHTPSWSLRFGLR